MIISLIAAVARDRAIGKDNDLLWNLPNDMKFFKESTMGHTVLMGRKNYESIPERFRPLPSRVNIVVSRSADYAGCEMARSIEEGIEKAKALGEEELFIIGGAQIYAQTLDLADRMYITEVKSEFPDADAHFPDFSEDDWKITELTHQAVDERHPHAFTILQYDRKQA
jgi:dihydrofolate reductase